MCSEYSLFKSSVWWIGNDQGRALESPENTKYAWKSSRKDVDETTVFEQQGQELKATTTGGSI